LDPLRLWTMTINRDRILAIVTDNRYLADDMPAMPDGGCLVVLDGGAVLPLGPDDTKLLSESLGGLHPR